MSTAIDSARVGTTREIDNDYIITYIRRRYFLSFMSTYSADYWYPKERRYIGKEGQDRNGQRAHQVCILQSAIRGTLELVKRQVDKLVMIV